MTFGMVKNNNLAHEHFKEGKIKKVRVTAFQHSIVVSKEDCVQPSNYIYPHSGAGTVGASGG